MENEEKILHMLQAIQEQMKAIEQEVSELKQERQAMQEQIAQLEKADEETEQRIEQVMMNSKKELKKAMDSTFGVAESMTMRLDTQGSNIQQLVDVNWKLIKRIERLESDVRLAKGAAANAMVNSWKL